MADVIEITAEVRERELRLTSIPMTPSGSRNHLRIRITFDSEWDGATKTLVAYRDLARPYHAPLGLDGTALIPHEVLAEQGVVYLGVFGVAGDQRVTSTIVRYGVNEGAITEGLQPSDPTPEMWEQLISAVNEVRQAAESAMRDAQTAAQGAQQSEQANAAATSAQQAQQSQIAAAGSATGAQASAAEATKQAAASEASAARAENAANEVEQSAQQIAGAIDRLAIHDTAAGNPTVIRDGADWQIEGLRVYGQSEQVTTTGAQMFDASTRIVGGIINNGVQASNSRYACSDYIPIPDGTTHLYQSGGAMNQRGFYGVDKAYLSKPTTNNVIDVPEGAKYIRITSDIDNQDMGNIMLCAGNTAKPFEPYTGGKPAPSPECPQEIVSREVSEIVVTGTNLLDCSTAKSNVRNVDIRFDGSILLVNNKNTYAAVVDIPITLDAGTYHMSVLSTTTNVPIYVTNKWFANGVSSSVKKATIKMAESGVYNVRITVGAQSTATIDRLMISVADMPYESYRAQTVKLSVPVTLRGVPVTSGGNVTVNGQRYMADRITERDGAVGVERRVKQFPLTGDEVWHTWGAHESGNIGFYGYHNKYVESGKINSGQALCSIIPSGGNAYGGAGRGCSVAPAPAVGDIYIIISVPQSSLADVSTKNAAIQSFKNLLKTLGNVEFLAMLYEPTFEPLPETDQQAIRELRTYHGNTVVTTGAWTETDYVADPKLYIDGKVNALVTAFMQSIPVTIPRLDEEVVDNEG